MRFVAVVVAAGSGSRLGGGEPKALRLLGDRPLVRLAVESMIRCGAEQVVVVAPGGRLDDVRAALSTVAAPVTVVPGGAERQQSVVAGLTALGPTASPIVLVHDAARPLVPDAVVARVLAAVANGATAVVPVVPVSDTIRRLGQDGSSELVDRTVLRAVQTPQGFDRRVLLDAHRRFAGTVVTDDATLCELAGHRVELVDGSAESIKITHPLDVLVAEAIIAGRAERVGG